MADARQGSHVPGPISYLSPIGIVSQEKCQRTRKMVHVARPTRTAHSSANMSGLFTGGLSRSSGGSENFSMSPELEIA